MKKYSSKRSIQLLAHILNEYGIHDVVISPGSRNAPLAIHFAESDSFHCYSIVDERSAAFVGMGMAMAQKKPVAITCTSGSAVANYYPAITEAFYSNIPLLVLTADRPTDFVDIFDGQTIRQNKIFQQHSYGDFQLLEDEKYDAEFKNREIIIKAVELCVEKSGPVHINIPLSEPLYDLVMEIPVFPSVEPTLQGKKCSIPSKLIADWNTSKRILILVGRHDFSPELNVQLAQLAKNHSAVVLCEASSNIHHEKFFNHIDRYIFNFSEEDYKLFAPDLLITVGQNVVSKKVKQFLRQAQVPAHWHIDPYWHPDTYFSLTEKIQSVAEDFFAQFIPKINLEPLPYFNLWDRLRDKRDEKHEIFLKTIGFSDFYIYYLLALKTPEHYNIHISNSSAIRYAQLFDYTDRQVYCNRGTSGIDGSTSTAMGFAIKSKNPTVLITGDISFLYDINGLWNPYIPPFTRIIVCNNGQGDIFKIIPGPGNANENTVNEFIATKHHFGAENIAKHFGFGYVRVDDDTTLSRVMDNFFKPDSKPKILEICTQEIENASILKSYFEFLKS
ncbi:MAG: 2-succinyl-5-enolpyruvyl-6-hydroxy-3-cyclohexene-1-carboxylic-acid synthase [Bacteroidetes bacterium]|nr:2-succinyl-5-enolpyruvyl-6-hydroxy-3-cyclohexene-1-carboxylic-acid synthase [Bacteroidota bacterium]